MTREEHWEALFGAYGRKLDCLLGRRPENIEKLLGYHMGSPERTTAMSWLREHSDLLESYHDALEAMAYRHDPIIWKLTHG